MHSNPWFYDAQQIADQETYELIHPVPYEDHNDWEVHHHPWIWLNLMTHRPVLRQHVPSHEQCMITVLQQHLRVSPTVIFSASPETVTSQQHQPYRSLGPNGTFRAYLMSGPNDVNCPDDHKRAMEGAEKLRTVSKQLRLTAFRQSQQYQPGLEESDYVQLEAPITEHPACIQQPAQGLTRLLRWHTWAQGWFGQWWWTTKRITSKTCSDHLSPIWATVSLTFRPGFWRLPSTSWSFNRATLSQRNSFDTQSVVIQFDRQTIDSSQHRRSVNQPRNRPRDGANSTNVLVHTREKCSSIRS